MVKYGDSCFGLWTKNQDQGLGFHPGCQELKFPRVCVCVCVVSSKNHGCWQFTSVCCYLGDTGTVGHDGINDQEDQRFLEHMLLNHNYGPSGLDTCCM